MRSMRPTLSKSCLQTGWNNIGRPPTIIQGMTLNSTWPLAPCEMPRRRPFETPNLLRARKGSGEDAVGKAGCGQDMGLGTRPRERRLISSDDCQAKTPNPKTPNPETPNPKTPNPKTPNPKTPNPKTPNRKTPNPKIPNPETPNPKSPKPETAQMRAEART
eukprot:1107330-Prorocentrum_minimum.AAC.2